MPFPQHMFRYPTYKTAREWVDGRRSSMPYRILRGAFYGGSGFALRPNEKDSRAIDVIDYWQAKNHKQDPTKYNKPRTLVTMLPDHFVYETESLVANNAYAPMGRLVAWLTGGTFYIRKYQLKKTNATHILLPEVEFERIPNGKLWTSRYKIPALHLYAENWYDAHAMSKQHGILVRNGFTFYDSAPPISHEPVLTRYWIPEKRREYLRTLKELRKHGEIRARMGAFDSALHSLRSGNLWRTWKEREELVKKIAEDFTTRSVEDHQAYVDIMTRGFCDQSGWSRRLDDPDALVSIFEDGLNRLKEPMRLSSGAVVYS